jgi:predicted PurR-regulated permease PerM
LSEQAALRVVFRSILLIVLVATLLWFAWTVRGVLVLLLIASILATGLTPIVDKISGRDSRTGKARMPRAVAVLLIYLALILLISLFAVGVMPPLIHQAEELVRNLPSYTEDLRGQLRALAEVYPFLAGLDQRLSDQLGNALGEFAAIFGQAAGVLRFALGLASGLLDFLLLLVLTLYLVVDGGQIRRWLIRLLPEESRPLAEGVTAGARHRISSWMIGQAALSLIIGTATYIGLTILGIPYALLLAVVAAVGELIPMVGPIISAVPAVIVALFISPVRALLTVGLYILIQQLENNLVVPMVMRRAINLPPVVVMAALLMGSEILGIIGAILSLPVAAAISVLIDELLDLRDRRSTVERETVAASGAEPDPTASA